MSKLKDLWVGVLTTVATLWGMKEAKSQIVLDQTQWDLYKNISFANGNYNHQPHASYSIIGNKNIDILISGSWSTYAIWRNWNDGGIFIDDFDPIGFVPTTIPNDTVGNTEINWNPDQSFKRNFELIDNNIGVNITSESSRSLADLNNDGSLDSYINTVQLPTPSQAQAGGLLPSDIWITFTPQVVSEENGSTLIAGEQSYKILNDNYEREDTTQGPTGRPDADILDWVTGPLSTQEVYAIKTSIYPNPTANELFIKTDNNETISEYRIVDLTGKSLIMGENLDKNEGINLQGVPAGIYILQLKTNNSDKIITHKVIKK